VLYKDAPACAGDSRVSTQSFVSPVVYNNTVDVAFSNVTLVENDMMVSSVYEGNTPERHRAEVEHCGLPRFLCTVAACLQQRYDERKALFNVKM